MPNELKRRLDDQLVWYVNGSLDADDCAFVLGYAQQHPEAEAEIRYWEAVRTAIRDTAPERPADAGVDKLMQRLRAERPTGAGGGLRRWLTDGWRALAAPRLGFAAASLIIVVQAGIIAVMLGDRGATEALTQAPAAQTRSLEPATPAAPYLKVRFKPAATARDIDRLLLDVDGGIVAGPMQSGYYAIKLREGDLPRAATRLRSSGVTDDVIAVESAAAGRP